MCSPNISSQSPRKSLKPCATLKCAKKRLRFRPLAPMRVPLALLLPLDLMLAPLALSAAPAQAQVERRELAPLPGAGAIEQRVPGAQQIAPASPGEMPPASGPGFEQPGSPLPGDLWRGLQPQVLQQLLAAAPLPSPSPTLATLIGSALAAGAESGGAEIAIRVGALERAGRVEEVVRLLSGAAQAEEPGATARYAVALLAAGRDDEACALKLGPAPETARADAEAKRSTFLVPAYCDVVKGDARGAALALQLARDSGVEAPLALAVIDRLTKTATRAPPPPKTVDVLDYVFLALDGKGLGPDLAAKSSPELLFRLAHDPQAPAELKLAAAERAAALNIIDGAALADAYRDAAAKLGKQVQSAPALRARLFAALEAAPSAKIRGQSIDALLASGRDAGIEIPLGQALAQAGAELVQDPQAAGFAETGVRVAALAGDDQAAWAWVDAGGAPLRGWQLLLAASNPSGARAEEALAGVDNALEGGLPPALLHRLVTVLDALDYEVPIPLWDATSKIPQPSDGYLPATGELSALKEAADAGDVGRTVLLVASALGPTGPAGANLIALGDAVRALKRVGLDQEARRLGFEALYAHWPTHGKA